MLWQMLREQRKQIKKACKILDRLALNLDLRDEIGPIKYLDEPEYLKEGAQVCFYVEYVKGDMAKVISEWQCQSGKIAQSTAFLAEDDSFQWYMTEKEDD